MGENISKHINDNALVTQTYKERSKFIKKMNNPIKRKKQKKV